MKKGVFILSIFLVSILLISFASAGWFSDVWSKITGHAAEGAPANAGEVPSIGPSAEEQTCMKSCYTSAGCELTVNNCTTTNKEKCMTQCGAKEPEETEDQKCVSDCVKIGCAVYDFDCQGKNQEKCDKQCGMVKEPEPKSEEEACIRACVKKEDPTLICQAGEGGEKGNEICQRCAAECVHLYAGPCLDDEKLSAKKKECETCAHCYGEPVMGDSGEGYECIVNVECKDATSEWGDEPGEGAGIGARTMDKVEDTFIAIGNFFENIFTNEESATDGAESSSGGDSTESASETESSAEQPSAASSGGENSA